VIAVVLNDVEHSRHLTEDENLVLSFEQRVQHLIQNFHLAANLDQVLVDEVEDSVFGQGVLDEVGVVGGLPHVHQSALDGEIEVAGAVGHVHFSVVGRRHWGLSFVAIFLKLRHLKNNRSENVLWRRYH